MRRGLFLASMIMLVMMSGCTRAPWTFIAGSKESAIVMLGYERTMIVYFPENDRIALGLAVKKCQTWGYVNAEPFGTEMETPLSGSKILVTRVYFCTGQGAESRDKK
jgi:hypothetical protein